MAKQKFRFAELYKKNKEAVERTLTALWCGETKNESQKSYVEQLRKIIGDIFAPADAVPLVQCMNTYESVHTVSKEEAESLVGDLWKKSLPQGEDWAPFEHQYQSWNTLLHGHDIDGKYKSIVVTTGTGSGKTECFMMPLVHDLIQKGKQEQVQAIFLYPLNALMEDQKARLETLVAGTHLRYAVYNGGLPEKMLDPSDKNYKKVLRKIDDIKGIKRDKQGNVISVKYPNAIATREELREHPANILLTNPTMLEYILLRDKDKKIINPDLKSLEWIAIDETHTYTGAGAAELAMLIRRVLMDYGVESEKVRFATSSATIGNAHDQESIENLRKFIAKIAGIKYQQVVHIGGERKGIVEIPHDEDEKYWLKLINDNHDGYLRLDELFNDGESILSQLEHLDRMCQKAEDLGLQDLRVKVHYFYRVPNHGLYVDLTQRLGGSFKIHTVNDSNAGKDGRAPMLELSRCKHCGEYVAVAEVNHSANTYSPISMDESDMFDLEDTEESVKKYMVFALSDQPVERGDNNASFIINGDKFMGGTPANSVDGRWRVVGNTQCSCPYCGSKLTKRNGASSKDPNVLSMEEQDGKKLLKFRVAADFISRILAPSTLDQMTEFESKDPTRTAIHKGQQYISFVDSRQSAARSTIKQNLEEERLWVYSTIFHELCRKSIEGISLDDAKAKQLEIIGKLSPASPEFLHEFQILQNLMSTDTETVQRQLLALQGTATLSWKEIFDLLKENPFLDIYCAQFAERSEQSKELDEDGQLTDETRTRYIQAIMVQYLSKRPLSAAAPETLGLFTSHYDKLNPVTNDELPDNVVAFNSLLSDENQIGKDDWKSLLYIFMDYIVRSNQSVYLKMSQDDPMDIFKCVRFSTTKESRRPVNKPDIKVTNGDKSRVIRLLAKLIAVDKNITIQDAIKGYADYIQAVVDDLWVALLDKYKLLSCSTQYDSARGQHVEDPDEIIDDVHYTPYRLNLADLSFKLYSDVYMCDVNVSKEQESRHVTTLRPLESTFKGYSPYIIGGEPQPVKTENHEEWKVYPHHLGSQTERQEIDDLRKWAAEERKQLWDHNLWSETGVFADRYEMVYRYPDLFVQAEHTAQVDKMISRKVQEDFRNHLLNILACSTTMEMGVNLGDLELVMMTSVPPQPSNYKQRAGRSGRRGQIRSACVTLCGSDSVGMRTLTDPMSNVIMHPTATPTVDLNSAQVVQRHVDSFLIKEFGVFNYGQHGGSIMQKVVDYYTNFEIVEDGQHSGHYIIQRKGDHAPVGPAEGLGDQTGTPYEKFNEMCVASLDPDLRERLETLLADTIFDGRVDYVVDQARLRNEKCYVDLEKRISDLKLSYQQAKSVKQQAFFKLKYIEPLNMQLLTYWATHRFTPNANMPVNVIEFDINSLKQKYYTPITPSNPSYPLRTALSQYAPGNPIARDGMVRIVRGVRYTNFFSKTVTFKKLYHNQEQAVIDQKDEIDNLSKWKVSGTPELELIQPTEFIPDENEPANRVLDLNEYTHVDAQLIDTNDWTPDVTEPHLFDARSNRDGGDGKILYYNEGLGFGYCHCTKCGRTVLERWVASKAANPDALPPEMNPVTPKDTDKPNVHFELVNKGGAKKVCIGCNIPGAIHRNVVLGDTITTDYTEIRIRHLNEDWISIRNGNVELLTTLGIVFTQSLAEILNIERGDIDFTVTPNGHICVFDTNPGGSGYANQLAEMDLLKSVIRKSLDILNVAEQTKSKDVLIDRYTTHYLNSIDVALAKSWIEEEIDAQGILPMQIKEVFPNATEVSLHKLLCAFESSQTDSVIFVDDNYQKWDYSGTEHGWRCHLQNRFVVRGQQTKMCVYGAHVTPMPEPIKDMIRGIKGWASDVVSMPNPYQAHGLYPLAYISGYLYFTNNPEHTSLNDRWGGGTMYYTKVGNLYNCNVKSIDTNVKPNTTCIFKLDDEDSEHIKTNGLGALISEKSEMLIPNFIEHCKNHPDDKIKVVYQDEHLKSILSIVICLQTIGYFLREAGNDFTLEFRLERYRDEHGRANSITSNQPSYIERDKWLVNMANNWIDDLLYDHKIEGRLLPVISAPIDSLTHWRELSFECAGKRLSIYPDGGFANEWLIDRNNPYYDVSDITYDAVIKLKRKKNIKYDVIIEDV